MAAPIPDPDYDYDVNLLVKAFKDALLAIAGELSRLDLTGISRANAKAALAEVAAILRGLNTESAAWVEKHVPKAATDGVIRAIVDLGAVETVEEAEKIAKFNRINREFVAAAVADTQADILAVTQNVDRRVKQAVRQATAESLRANLTKGVNGQRTLNADMLQRMRKTLGSAIDTGIVDSASRRWSPENYVQMLTRTKMSQTHREATTNEAVSRGAYYAVVSRHGAKDACSKYEGTIVKLTPDAPGSYPYVGDIPRRELFHPCCRHTLSPIRDPKEVRRLEEEMGRSNGITRI
ncbi:phage minor capsid protein [Paenibacillus sabinae]|uniref:Rhs family protein n=1 Tax=Paenibacillus sabinae T27 TaxID=1268072 RepID=X4ZP83_9BACL|nr:phage minor capsid protein [Paenibacillus sabinae]AHV98992.1 rhs family protein [Paenibacillus sabinae T27]